MNEKALIYKVFVMIFTLLLFLGCTSQPPFNYGKVEHKLFLNDNEKQPLVVGFGGSEGGNIYAKKETKELREKILENGFAFLSIGYFGTTSTPKEIDRISLNAIYDTINKIAGHPKIDKNRIVLLGGSRGGELVLNLGVHFKDFDAIIAMVAPNINLPSKFGINANSSWTYYDKEIPYARASKNSIQKIRKGDFHSGMKSILKENETSNFGKIEIEKINCPVLLISAQQDEVWPSTEMAEQMIKRLNNKNLKHSFEHIPLEGNHSEPVKRIDLIVEFLNNTLNK